MIWTIIAIVFSGLGAAGVALILRKLTRNKLPKWIIPVFAGMGMLGYQISYEYSWFEHQVTRQPEAAVVVSTETGQVFWRPWTYHFPMIIAFTVIDTDNMVKTEVEGNELVEFILYRFEKQHVDLVSHQAYLLNCSSAEMLPMNQQGEPILSQFQRIDKNGILFLTACGEA
ncbi:hypothetical protein [Nitrincola schmidtii]|uniref:hypothetical protein n=1 Tax=Nitrincola schmidtii TaxID=1730894 RepID=UPI00124C3818|nr:hypothetical protein [Nitrincola schmidtii]